jgi:hypothetical protein
MEQFLSIVFLLQTVCTPEWLLIGGLCFSCMPLYGDCCSWKLKNHITIYFCDKEMVRLFKNIIPLYFFFAEKRCDESYYISLVEWKSNDRNAHNNIICSPYQRVFKSIGWLKRYLGTQLFCFEFDCVCSDFRHQL